MQPLDGIVVLDLSRILAGPWCTQILADLGARVIKIEHPANGDDTRHWGPPWLKDKAGNPTKDAAYYLSANRGKQSVAVDIATTEGQEFIRTLAKSADVVVENFKVGGLAKYGLDYAGLKEVNPALVYLSVTGFGQTGPRAAEAGYDYLIQAMSGLMSITGVPDGQPGAGPMRVGVAVSDITTGLYGVIGVLAALRHRDNTGVGQHVDLALLDTQVSWLANQAQNYFNTGVSPVRTGAQHPNLAPYQPFETQDGFVVIAIGNDIQFKRFTDFINRPDLAADERFATNPLRVTNQAELASILTDITRQRTSAEWLESLPKIAVPCGPINTIEQALEDPQVKARGMVIDMEHSTAGSIKGLANPLKFSETPIVYGKAPPTLGEDTDTLKKEFGN
ncbi:hypothetical protein GCM10017044_14420 [Kordiimonas sediminis]|uniref:CoA transferase n=1 Tax=Kordiimonas sediminis TaxID=1735581 RepID=A0A919ASX7_9PROT|nr:CaiB/BaiF CoA-transferase family protein [Kordiimonas sediminis]GHF20635.1 hypothetical protein GCM10017044_14420 [Kordiimonas sediminis]